MRLKYYLRGMGIGITFATLLLTISFYFGRDALTKERLTDAEIIERATALGMTMPEDEIKVESEVSDEDKDSEEKAKTDEKTDSIEEDSNETIEEEIVPTAAVDETKTYVPFSIKGGQSSEIVCSNLEKAGLIDDADKFNKYLNELDVDNLVKSGTFYIQQGSSYDDIVALLVNKNTRSTTPPKAEEAPKAPTKPSTPKAGE